MYENVLLLADDLICGALLSEKGDERHRAQTQAQGKENESCCIERPPVLYCQPKKGSRHL
jgi:hypothetical protein